MKAFYVESRTKTSNSAVRSGPFTSRTEAERMAVETVKRGDVQPGVSIVAVEVEEDETKE
jgi:hypothetical protein